MSEGNKLRIKINKSSFFIFIYLIIYLFFFYLNKNHINKKKYNWIQLNFERKYFCVKKRKHIIKTYYKRLLRIQTCTVCCLSRSDRVSPPQTYALWQTTFIVLTNCLVITFFRKLSFGYIIESDLLKFLIKIIIRWILFGNFSSSFL